MDTRFVPFIHVRLAAASLCNAQWDMPQAVTANVLRAFGRSGDAVAVSVFTWISSPRGLAGFFYVMAAREPDYRRKQNDFARILQSFRIMGAATGAGVTPADLGAKASEEVQYVKFTEPKEGAYTLGVPAGWKTEGGLFRFHAVDDRRGVVVGTNTDTHPSVDFRALLQLP